MRILLLQLNWKILCLFIYHGVYPIFWRQGLITEERENIDPDALPFARKVKEIGRQGLMEGASLEEVVCIISSALSKL